MHRAWHRKYDQIKFYEKLKKVSKYLNHSPVHPLGPSSFPSEHRLHFCPVIPGLHMHLPVICSQSSRTDPNELHPHAVCKRKITSWYLKIRSLRNKRASDYKPEELKCQVVTKGMICIQTGKYCQYLSIQFMIEDFMVHTVKCSSHVKMNQHKIRKEL